MGKVFLASFVLPVFWALSMPDAQAQAEVSKEYQVKAAFLFNFAHFIQWPPEAFADDQSPFVIGVLGDDPFGAFLDETVHGEKIGGHSLVVERYRRAEDIKACHILFVSRSETKQAESILAGLKNRNVLTVGDIEVFIKDGGIIQFTTERNKIHLKINPAAAKNANLAVSSKLLRLAEIVTTENK